MHPPPLMKLTMHHRLRLLCLLISLFTSSSCKAQSSHQAWKDQRALVETKRLTNHLDTSYSDHANYYYYMGSPLSLPPYQEIMGPSSSPQENPPICINTPPLTPFPPTTILPTPSLPLESPPPPPAISTTPPFLTPNPPPFSSTPNPPEFLPWPPAYVPINPPTFAPVPPSYDVPNPPLFMPGPPWGPPPIFVPGPPVFEPPVVYPPPLAPPPPVTVGPAEGLWCVAKPSVPDPIIQEAMNYACGSGADCDAIEANGACYNPDTVLAHATYAFNSYWQRTRVNGGSCDFGGTGMLVTKDPSYDGCNFNIN